MACCNSDCALNPTDICWNMIGIANCQGGRIAPTQLPIVSPPPADDRAHNSSADCMIPSTADFDQGTAIQPWERLRNDVRCTVPRLFAVITAPRTEPASRPKATPPRISPLTSQSPQSPGLSTRCSYEYFVTLSSILIWIHQEGNCTGTLAVTLNVVQGRTCCSEALCNLVVSWMCTLNKGRERSATKHLQFSIDDYLTCMSCRQSLACFTPV